MTTTAIERPILFSGPMVRAILAGTKTQTRRVVKPQPELWPAFGENRFAFRPPIATPDMIAVGIEYAANSSYVTCPFGAVGDLLWVKEKHTMLDRDGWWNPSEARDWIDPLGRRNGVGYADNETDFDSERCRKEYGYRWRPSIHMPRWASRITLLVKSVRVERLLEINSSEDILAEGVECPQHEHDCSCAHHINAFADLWDSINAKRHPWASNPWVWVVEFERVRQGETQ